MPKTLSFQLFSKTNKMRKFYYKEKKMEIKQKHGKHALRKAVTAAVLAGTAFSSLGGFAGAVTTVKAEEYNDVYKNYIDDDNVLINLVKSIREKNLHGKELEEEILNLLKLFSTEKLNLLLLELGNEGFEAGNNIEFSLIKMVVFELSRRAKESENLNFELSKKNEELKEKEGELLEVLKEKRHVESELDEKKSEISKKESELSEIETELSENNEELTDALKELYNAKEKIDEKKSKIKDLTEKLDNLEKELGENDKKLSEAAKQNFDLSNENKELKENLEMAEGITEDLQKKALELETAKKELEAELKVEKEALEAEKAKLADSEKANEKLTEERDAAKKEAEKVPELEEQVEKLVEEITAAKKEAEDLQAKAEALEKDFESVKAEKEKLEAEIAKMKEDHQKEVDALNALLADKETMLKNLQDQLDKAKEEAMKNEQMSQEEKAKLQAELDKAKQELAEKIKDMPNKVAPQAEGKANAGQAAPNQNQNNQAQANQAKNANNLPSTGDKPVNPLLVASGLSLMIGAGAFVYAGKRKKG